MPKDQSPYDVVPIKGIGLVAVPKGMPLADLHASIMNHPAYQSPNPPNLTYPEKGDPSLPAEIDPIPEITKRGAVENSPPFRNAARKAWNKTVKGSEEQMFNPMFGSSTEDTEAGFTVSTEGNPSKVTEHQGDSLRQKVDGDTLAAFHTHPPVRDVLPGPSAADIGEAERVKRPIIVADRDGLWEIDAIGNIRQVYAGTKWMKSPTEPKQ